MQTITISQITQQLQQLLSDKLAVVYDFISYLLDRTDRHHQRNRETEILQTMLASEAVLRRDWERSEEETAWANL